MIFPPKSVYSYYVLEHFRVFLLSLVNLLLSQVCGTWILLLGVFTLVHSELLHYMFSNYFWLINTSLMGLIFWENTVRPVLECHFMVIQDLSPSSGPLWDALLYYFLYLEFPEPYRYFHVFCMDERFVLDLKPKGMPRA